MRLIKVYTLKFEEFEDERTTPRYGILSHRWRSQEVTFQDIESGAVSSRAGFHKLRKFCTLAAQDGLSHGWVDTCCINKDSSAELSEAINSMYRWYQSATRCYAYLDDVDANNAIETDSDSDEPFFAHSEWFERGWT